MAKLQASDIRAFHTMVKPSGAQCNLDCEYCFYLHKEELLQRPKSPRIYPDVLEAHIKQYIMAQEGPVRWFLLGNGVSQHLWGWISLKK